MNLKFWSWGKKTSPDNPRCVIELLPDSRIRVNCEWPKPESEMEAALLAKNVAAVISMVNTGELLPAFQGAVTIAGLEYGLEDVANTVLSYLNNAYKNLDEKNVLGPDRLVVPPTKAFSVKGSNE